MDLLRTGLLLSLAFAAASAARAADLADVRACDQDGSGLVEEDELRFCLLSVLEPEAADLDTNKDGAISAKEARVYWEPDLLDLRERYGPPPYTVKQLADFFPLEGELSLGGVLIRRSYQQVTLSEPAKSFKKAEGALFSFSDDQANDVESWQAKGAVIGVLKLREKSDKALTAIGFVPSLEFERNGVDGPDETQAAGDSGESPDPPEDAQEEVDRLVLRAGFDFEVIGKGPGLQNFRIFVAHATDFDFDSGVNAIQLQWEPTHNQWGLGVFRPVGGIRLDYRLRFLVHAELGEIGEAGEKLALEEDDTFSRLGPEVQLELQPSGFRRLTLKAQWRNFYRVGGDGPDHVEMFIAGAALSLDRDGHFSLEAEYQNGRAELTLEDTDLRKVGLAIKF